MPRCCLAIAISEPSCSVPMQPASSQLDAVTQIALSFGVRASRVGCEPFAHRKRVAAGTHHGKAPVAGPHGDARPVGRDQHIGLRRTASAQIMRTPISSAPTKRSGALAAGTARPGRACKGAAGRCQTPRMRPTAPGNVVTQRATAIIQSIPRPIIRQQKPSRPSGMASTPTMPHGMTQADTTGMASKVARSRQRARGDENGTRCRGSSRCRRAATQVRPAISRPPQSAIRAPSGVSAPGRHPRQAVLIASNQRQRRCKRHLEARMARPLPARAAARPGPRL